MHARIAMMLVAAGLGNAWAAPALSPSARSATVPAEGPAQLTKASGLVRVAAAGTEVWQEAAPPMPLRAGDRVKTAWGRAELAFPDGSTIRLQRDTTFEVRQAEQDPRTGGRRIVAWLQRGLIRAIVKPLRTGDGFVVQSASAVCAVKGTDFAFDGGGVAVFDEADDASHEVTFSDSAQTATIVVGENMWGGFGADGTIGEPLPIDAAQAEGLRQSFDRDPGPPPEGDVPGEPLTIPQGLAAAAPASPEPPVPAPEAAAADVLPDLPAVTLDPGLHEISDRVSVHTDDAPVVTEPGVVPLCGPDAH